MRKYLRKTEERSPETIVNALRAIRIGMSIRAASRDFGVSDRVLRRHLQNNQSTTTYEEVDTADTSMEIEENSRVIASVTTETVTITTTQSTTTTTAAQSTSTATKPITTTVINEQQQTRNFFINHPGHPTVRTYFFSNFQ